jgi:hypothetical protein
MPLSINDSETLFGRFGARGSDGSNGTSIAPDGTAGGAGRPGRVAALTRTGQGFTGDAGDDRVQIGLAAEGGAGGGGGRGGAGAFARSDTVFLFGPTSDFTSTTYVGSGEGGSGGRGGNGGAAEVGLSALVLDLASVPGGLDRVLLQAQATGGSGNIGGSGGAGGSSGSNSAFVLQFGAAPDLYTRTTESTGSAGGETGNAGAHGRGARSLVAFDDVTVTGATLTLQVSGLAGGGTGATGTLPFANGTGVPVADGRPGGDGGSGGAAIAQVTDLDVSATDALELFVVLSAVGGFGGAGGTGARAVAASTSTGIALNGIGGETTTDTFARAGSGGDGGAGGAATTVLAGSAVTGSTGDDLVLIDLRAMGGLGGTGGGGGTGAAGSTVTGGSPDYTVTRIVIGTPDGRAGSDGALGDARIVLTDTSITLGEGDDSLGLLLAIALAGTPTFDVARNAFDGGRGTDTLSIGNSFSDGQPDVVFNVHAGIVRAGGGAGNTMTGFEAFAGGTGADRFIDGVGHHAYRGGPGADHFAFAAGRDGDDTVWDVERGEDVIRFRGFGPVLNDFADVLAAATQVAGGVLIRTSATSSVLLSGVQIADLAANDFVF